MSISSRSGWGQITALINKIVTVSGVSVTYIPNTGVGIQVQPGIPSRITKLKWAIRPGPNNPPDNPNDQNQFGRNYRLCVFLGQTPQDISIFQQPQDFGALGAGFDPNGFAPTIPNQSPLTVLSDTFIGDNNTEGAHILSGEIEFPDAGPNASSSDFLSIILVPLVYPETVDSTNTDFTQTDFVYLEAWGTSFGASGQASPQSEPSLPRFGIPR